MFDVVISVHMQVLEAPEGAVIDAALWLSSFLEEGEHKWEGVSLPEDVIWGQRTETSGMVFWGHYDPKKSSQGYTVSVILDCQNSAATLDGDKILVQGTGKLYISAHVQFYEEFRMSRVEDALEQLRTAGYKYDTLLERNKEVHGGLMRRFSSQHWQHDTERGGKQPAAIYFCRSDGDGMGFREERSGGAFGF